MTHKEIELAKKEAIKNIGRILVLVLLAKFILGCNPTKYGNRGTCPYNKGYVGY